MLRVDIGHACLRHGIKVWETATGGERCQFIGFAGDAFALAFAPDGRRLASACGDTTALIWDLTHGALSEPSPAGKQAPALDDAWTDLASPGALTASRAIWQLVGRPAQAVTLLGKQLKPVTGPEEKQILQTVRRLDSDDFDTRQQADRELAELGDLAEPSLRKADWQKYVRCPERM
jgi:hypothetical protein